jgi:hypothetical protein
MNRRILLTTSMMTPAERSRGRFMRAPDGHEGGTPPAQGGSDSTPPANNTGGNSADSTNPTGTGDNTSQGDPLAGFWEGKPEKDAGASDSSAAEAEESRALGTELKGVIDSFAPPPAFTEDIAKQVAEGNFDGVNQAMAAAHRATIQQSVGVVTKLLGAIIPKLQADLEQRVQTAMGNQESDQFLQQNFPEAKNPAFAPVVDRVWKQSLVNAKGNREEAIRQTRGMLQAMGSQFAGDDIRSPASDPHAGIDTAASKSLVAQLLQRE